MKTHHQARYPLLWCSTTEEDRIIRENRKLIPEDVNFFSWDICSGYQQFVKVNGDGPWMWQMVEADCQDPGEALGMLENLPENSIIFAKDFHKFLVDITIIRKTLNVKEHLKANAKTIVFLSAVIEIPIELQNDITVIDFPMPDREALEGVLNIVAEDNELPLPEDKDAVVDAMRGLTQEGAENALCKALVEKKSFDYKTILDEKAAMLKASGVLTYGKYEETFDDLYGLEYMKEFCTMTMQSDESRGVLIYGVPGTGKSHFAKALANETKRPCITANFGALRGKYQGDAEGRMDLMLKTIEAVGRSLVYVDEFEKSIAGTGSSETDGGVGQRILGRFLSYMEDRPPGGSYWVCTVNSLDDILTLSGGALARRYDCIFFLDMPSPEECKGIAKIWSEKKRVKIPEDYDFDGFTGADIAKLARNMAMLDCDADKARQFLIPSSQSIGPKIAEIRKKAKDACIWASKTEDTVSKRRRVKL